MRDQPHHDVQEPDDQGGNYEAQAASSAPAAPTRERQTEQPAEEAQAADERPTGTTPQATGGRDSEPKDGAGLIQDQRWEYFAGRWDSIQSGFVDDPRRTVEQADRLVAEVIDHLSKIFRDERSKLESQWSRGGKADTEDLRLAMQRYRDFFRTLVGR